MEWRNKAIGNWKEVKSQGYVEEIAVAVENE